MWSVSVMAKSRSSSGPVPGSPELSLSVLIISGFTEAFGNSRHSSDLSSAKRTCTQSTPTNLPTAVLMLLWPPDLWILPIRFKMHVWAGCLGCHFFFYFPAAPACISHPHWSVGNWPLLFIIINFIREINSLNFYDFVFLHLFISSFQLKLLIQAPSAFISVLFHPILMA